MDKHENMKTKSILKGILPFLPLFVFLCIAIFSRSSTYSTSFIADESKFYQHAENITRGFYAEAVNPNLMEGPGYPLYLAISAAFNFPYVWSRASNIILLFLAALYLFLILRLYIDRRPAIVLTYLFGLYPPMLRWANLMYSESLMLLLLLGFCYHFILWYRMEEKHKRHYFLAILFLGYLALTKIIFAYVLVAALIGAFVFLVLPRIAKAYRLKTTALMLVGALAVLSPYVVYTYHLTGKFFYLGMHGGNILYFRSSPYENEFGNFYSEWHILDKGLPAGREEIMVNMDQLRKNHGQFFASMDSLSWMEKDSVLTAKAIKNIKEHPSKYLKNTVANVSRIFFHYPFSYRIQNLDTLGYLIPNIFIVVLAVLGIYPAVIRRSLIPKELVVLLLISLIYLGGHTLLGGRGRFLIPVVPIWMLFYSFVYFRILRIGLRDSKQSELKHRETE